MSNITNVSEDRYVMQNICQVDSVEINILRGYVSFSYHGAAVGSGLLDQVN